MIYKIIDLHNYLLMMLDGKILRGLFKHERLKPAIIRTSQGTVCNLLQLKEVVNIGMKMSLILFYKSELYLLMCKFSFKGFI